MLAGRLGGVTKYPVPAIEAALAVVAEIDTPVDDSTFALFTALMV